MKRLILIGGKEDAASYIQSHIDDCNVPSYKIVRFNEKLKISDVRDLKKRLSMREEKRTVLITSGVLSEAQHALLKTLEEMALDTTFIICAEKEDDLLPTIRSRCQIMRVGQTKDVKNELTEKLVDEYVIDKGYTHHLQVSLLLAGEIAESNFKDAILQLRRSMQQYVNSQNISGARTLALLIASLQETAYFVGANNFNAQLAFEHVLLKK